MCAIYEYLKYACVANCGVVLNCEGPVELASFPGLPQLQFLIACSMQKQSQKVCDPRQMQSHYCAQACPNNELCNSKYMVYSGPEGCPS